MRKETILAVVVVVAVVGAVLGWLLFSFPSETEPLAEEPAVVPVTGEIKPVVTDNNAGQAANRSEESLDSGAGDEETRIILVDPDDSDNSELSELLSEKVIRNDKVVDK